jgi:hypothetical protein
MKKRVIALAMTLALCFGILPVYPVYAADAAGTESISTDSVQKLSNWVISDLIIGVD